MRKRLVTISITITAVMIMTSCMLPRRPAPDNKPQETTPPVSAEQDNPTEVNDDAAEQNENRKGSESNPVKLNETVRLNNMHTFEDFKIDIEMTMTEIIRGNDANQMVKEGNKFNKEPDEGKEYLLVRFKIKGLNGDTPKEWKDPDYEHPEGGPVYEPISFSPDMFQYIDQNGEYQISEIVDGIDDFEDVMPLSDHDETEGYAAFLVNKGEMPMLRFAKLLGTDLHFKIGD